MFYVLYVGLMVLAFRIPCSHSFIQNNTDKNDGFDFKSTGEDSEKTNDYTRAISIQKLSEDDALIKSFVLDATGGNEPSEDLLKQIEAEFLSTLLRLVGNGEIYKDARIAAITAALQNAFLVTMGSVDHGYIEQVLRMIREKDDQERRQDEDHETNILGSDIKDSDVKDPVKDEIEISIDNTTRKRLLVFGKES